MRPRLGPRGVDGVVQLGALALAALLAGPSPLPLALASAVVLVRLVPGAASRPWVATLDAFAIAAFLISDGAPDSPLLPVALAGAWRGPGVAATAYCGVFGLAYIATLLSDGPRVLLEAAKTVGLVVLVAALRRRRPLVVVLPRRSRRVAAVSAPEPLVRPLALAAIVGDGAPGRVVTALGEARLAPAVIAAAASGLTAEQTELLAYLALGLSNRRIADALCVSEATVKYRLTQLYRRLEVHRRADAVARAHDLGLATTLATLRQSLGSGERARTA